LKGWKLIEHPDAHSDSFGFKITLHTYLGLLQDVQVELRNKMMSKLKKVHGVVTVVS